MSSLLINITTTLVNPTAATNDSIMGMPITASTTNTSSYVYPVPYVVVLSVVLLIEMLAGVLSNLAVLFSYHVNKKFIRSVSDVFIINMNVVDIIICLVSIPATLVAVLSNPSIPLFCFFHEATVSFASVASAVNVAVISLDRYDKISHPLVRKFTMRNVRWILPITWLLSLLGFCSPLFGINLEKFDRVQKRFESEGHHCFYWFFSSRDNHFYELYYIPIFFVATFVMIYAYYGIIRITRVKTIHSALVKATVSMKVDNDRKVVAAAINNKDPEKRVSRTTTIIILTFITCWGPHALVSIVIVARGYASSGEIALDMLERWLVVLGYTTTLMHPILYVFMRRNFRRAFSNSWFARCAVRHRVGAARSAPSQDEPECPRAVLGTIGKRQSDRNLVVSTRVEKNSNLPQTSTKATVHAHVVREEHFQLASSSGIRENIVLLDSDHVDMKEPMTTPHAAYVISPPAIAVKDPTFKCSDSVPISSSVVTEKHKNAHLPNVD
ncbi:probable G-protein coupled receptor 22 [Acanthaster planci]|uniref:Probable G-protein coupled receptor 22 n=1 Tax=Acanthaster planci TaxID=133434 RepID=A0A8B7ZIY8_ACAPL|nr:probable G-protein coupled receptor 22 [Acanthaster planci]XP_022104850.1 probable G-protein coupled receptor 22 [Acanthaster planci]